MRNRWINTEPDRSTSYDGAVAHARGGVHEAVADAVTNHVGSGSRVIDVGAGAGALSRQLADLGFRVTACDIDAAKWQDREIAFLALDLNEPLPDAVQRNWHAACCVEVIEHVENPWHLMRQLAGIVAPGGHLILSTPNVTSFVSRVQFLRSGRFHQFDEPDLVYGHINPVTSFEIDVIARETGWRVIENSPAGYLPLIDVTGGLMKGLAYGVARFLAWMLAGTERDGWCRVFVLVRLPTTGA